jgi:KaiC/GvpD/RAD55 family RecA-like ATPase
MQKLVPEKGFTLTGISGLDEMLGGGIPTGHAVSIFGGPGAGKTTFTLQFLHNGATMYDEPGIYVSLDESICDIKRNVRAFGWDFEKLEKEQKIVFLDASFFKRISDVVKVPEDEKKNEKGYSINSLRNLIDDTIQEMDAKRVVVDPMSTLIFQYPDLNERRLAVIDLITTLRSRPDCTSLIIMDLRSSTLEREYQIEEFLTQGTIILQTMAQPEAGLIRVGLIEKMRGTEHDTQPHPYLITKQGVALFPKEKVYATTSPSR